ncbi:hypothetical protein H0H92_003858 [Tricholoma furcatifolium]|nr:hypothetical protein H0H92_003858 [Tricholoma furcatifolium]
MVSATSIPLSHLCLLGLSAAHLATAATALPNSRVHGHRNTLRPIPKVPIPTVDTARPVVSRNGTVLPPYTTVYEFDQLIDHDNPSLGTFTQRFWHTYEFYEPGGPIILFTPGEVNADGYSGYLTNGTINGQVAQQQNGSTIVLEHRFYGFSNPYPDLSVESLRVHTIQQAIDDLVYFAENVNLPMPGGNEVTPSQAPWVLIGGSYSGALTSWTMVDKPGIFWAGYASSAVVEAILDFWQYFEPIRLNMPQNCSADVQAVIAHVDEVFTGTDAAAIQALKDNWGLGDMTHLDDVAGSLRNNMWDWQSLQVFTGPGGQFFDFCDALEVKNGEVAPASGFGLDHALTAWGAYWNETYYALRRCTRGKPYACNPPRSASLRLRTYFKAQAESFSNIYITRLQRQCQYMFPTAFPNGVNVQVNRTNELYAGWDVNIDRLFFANGIRKHHPPTSSPCHDNPHRIAYCVGDPWKDATVSSVDVDRTSTETQPIEVGDGFHCSDLLTESGSVDATVLAVQQKALGFMQTWLAEWTRPAHGVGTSFAKSAPVTSSQTAPEHAVKPVNAFSKNVRIALSKRTSVRHLGLYEDGMLLRVYSKGSGCALPTSFTLQSLFTNKQSLLEMTSAGIRLPNLSFLGIYGDGKRFTLSLDWLPALKTVELDLELGRPSIEDVWNLNAVEIFVKAPQLEELWINIQPDESILDAEEVIQEFRVPKHIKLYLRNAQTHSYCAREWRERIKGRLAYKDSGISGNHHLSKRVVYCACSCWDLDEDEFRRDPLIMDTLKRVLAQP